MWYAHSDTVTVIVACDMALLTINFNLLLAYSIRLLRRHITQCPSVCLSVCVALGIGSFNSQCFLLT